MSVAYGCCIFDAQGCIITWGSLFVVNVISGFF